MTTLTPAAKFARALYELNCPEEIFDVTVDSDLMDDVETELGLLGCAVERYEFKSILRVYCLGGR